MKKVTIKTPERKPEIEKAKKIYKLIGEVTKVIDSHVNSIQDLNLLFNTEMRLYEDRLQEYCEKMMLLLPDQYGRKVEDFIWRKGFYEIIQVVKQNIHEVQRDKNLKERYREYLLSGVGYYNRLYYKLRKEFGGVNGDGGDGGFMVLKNNKRSKRQMDEKTKKWWLHACQRCLVYMGDLARYQFLLDRRPCDHLQSQLFYNMAITALPSSGLPYKQLGILAHADNNIYNTIYYYLRCILSSINNGEADNNLILLFQKNKLDLKNNINNNKINGDNNNNYIKKEKISDREMVIDVVDLMDIFYNSQCKSSRDPTVHHKCQNILKLLNHKYLTKRRTNTPLVDASVKKNALANSDAEDMLKIATIFISLTHILEKKNSNLSAVAMAFSIAMFSHVLHYVLNTLHGYRRNRKRAGKEAEVSKRILDKGNEEEEEGNNDDDDECNHLSEVLKLKRRRRRRRLHSDDDDDEEDEVSEDCDDDDSDEEDDRDDDDDDLSEGVYDSDDGILRRPASSSPEVTKPIKSNCHDDDDNDGDDNDGDDGDGDDFQTLRTPSYYKIDSKCRRVEGDKMIKDDDVDEEEMKMSDKNICADQIVSDKLERIDKADDNDDGTKDNMDSDDDKFDSGDKKEVDGEGGSGDKRRDDNDEQSGSFFQAIPVPPGYEDSMEQQHVMEINHKLINFTIDTDSDTHHSQNEQEYDDSTNMHGELERQFEVRYVRRVVEKLVGCDLIGSVHLFTQWLLANHIVASVCAQSSSVIWQRLCTLFNFIPDLELILACFQNNHNNSVASDSIINHRNMSSSDSSTKNKLSSNFLHAVKPQNRKSSYLKVDYELRDFAPFQAIQDDFNFNKNINLSCREQALLTLLRVREEGMKLANKNSLPLSFHQLEQTFYTTPTSASSRDVNVDGEGMIKVGMDNHPESFMCNNNVNNNNNEDVNNNIQLKIQQNSRHQQQSQQNCQQQQQNCQQQQQKSQQQQQKSQQKLQQQQNVQHLEDQNTQHLQHQRQQQQFMRNMAQLRLQSQVNQLESTLKRTNHDQPLYLICHTPSLCQHWTLIKKICNSGKFLIIVPLAAIDQLDRWKGSERRAREVVRWLEQQFERASKVIRAQRSNEVTLPPNKLTPSKEDPDKLAYMRSIDCCKYFVRKNKGSDTKNALDVGSDAAEISDVRGGAMDVRGVIGDVRGGIADGEDGRSVCFLSSWAVESSELNDNMRRSLGEVLKEGLLLQDVKSFHDKWLP